MKQAFQIGVVLWLLALGLGLSACSTAVEDGGDLVTVFDPASAQVLQVPPSQAHLYVILPEKRPDPDPAVKGQYHTMLPDEVQWCMEWASEYRWHSCDFEICLCVFLDDGSPMNCSSDHHASDPICAGHTQHNIQIRLDQPPLPERMYLAAHEDPSSTLLCRW